MKFKHYLWSLITVLALSMCAASCDDDDDPVTPPEPAKPLSFDFKVDKVTAHSAELSVIPSNTTDTYFADLAAADQLAKMSEEQILETISRNRPDELFTGTVSFKGSYMNLEADTEYILFAVGCDEGGFTTGLQQTSFRTARDETSDNPEVTLEGCYSEQEQVVVFSMKCLSRDAVYAGALPMPSNELEKTLQEGATLESLLDPAAGMVTEMDQSFLTYFNGDEGFEFTFGRPEGVRKGETIAFLLDTRNKTGRTIKRADATYEGESYDPDASGKLEVEFTSGPGDAQRNNKDQFVWVRAVCTTRNAGEARILASMPDNLDPLVDAGKTFEQIADELADNMQQFADDWMIDMNKPDVGLELYLNSPADFAWSFLLDTRNKDHRIVKRSDTKTEQSGPASDSKVRKINEKEFIDLVWDFKSEAEFTFKGNKPVVLDFYAVWCGPCKQMSPVLDQLSMTYDGRVDFYKVDVDATPAPFRKFAVDMGLNPKGYIPFLIFIDSNGRFDYHVGAMSQPDLESQINALLNTEPGTDSHSGPIEIEMQAGNGDDNGYDLDKYIWFTARCPTRNTSNAGVLMMDPSLLNPDSNLEEIIDTNRGELFFKFKPEWVDQLNGAGTKLYLDSTPDTSWALLLEAVNSDHRIVRRTDAATAPVSTQTAVKDMDDNGFRTLVWDYEQTAEFTYLGKRPMFLDFGATWCGWCSKLAPVIDELSLEFKDRMDFYRLDIDISRMAWEKLIAHVGCGRGLPLFVTITESGQTAFLGGAQTKEDLRKLITDALAGGNTPDPEKPTEGPKFTIEGSFDTKTAEVVVHMQCQSKDAESARWFVSSEEDYRMMAGWGFTDESIMADADLCDEFLPDELAGFNGEGIRMAFTSEANAIQLGTNTICLVSAANAKGTTLKRIELLAADGGHAVARPSAVRGFIPEAQHMTAANRNEIRKQTASDSEQYSSLSEHKAGQPLFRRADRTSTTRKPTIIQKAGPTRTAKLPGLFM